MAQPYNPSLPTGLDLPLIPTKVSSESFIENIFLTDLQQLMGSSALSPIHLDFMEKGDGDTYVWSLVKEPDYKNFIQGPFEQVSGTGGPLQYYADSLKFTQNAAPPVMEYGTQYMKLASPVDITARSAEALRIAHRRHITWSILKSACTDLYPNPATQGPIKERVLYTFASEGDNGVYAANIADSLALMTGTTAPDQCGSSVASINQMRMMSVMGADGPGTDVNTGFETEKKINPVVLETDRGYSSPTYLYLQDPMSFNSGLRLDAGFGSRYYGRGVIESPMQPSQLKGSFFRGAIEDVEIVDVPELGSFQIKNAAGDIFAHNLFIGAQAFKFIWGQMPWIESEWRDFKRAREWTIQDIRGVKAVQFQSYYQPNTVVECGIIHHFVKIRAAGDLERKKNLEAAAKREASNKSNEAFGVRDPAFIKPNGPTSGKEGK